MADPALDPQLVHQVQKPRHRSPSLNAHQHGLREIELPHLVTFVQQRQIHHFSGRRVQHRQCLLASMQVASYDSHSASFGPSAIRVNGEPVYSGRREAGLVMTSTGKSKRKKEPIATADEFRRVLQHISEPFRIMCIVAMCLGLRVGELLGLKWSAVDWEGSRIAIRQSYVYGQLGDVKTPHSHRWMPLDRSLAEKLNEHQARSVSTNDDDWVFANPQTGRPFWPGRIQENWLVPAAKKAGLGRIGWHTFRHSHSSLLHALGVDLKVQQELLRHADIRTTMNIYTHTVPKALREANSKVVEVVIPGRVA
jgi:integrase